MLDLIRNKSQSLGVKIAFGIIIAVFIFWGFGSIQNINNSTTVITVNDEAISVVDFERAYHYQRSAILEQYPQITPEQLKFAQIPRMVIDSLVNDALLKEEIKRLNFSVSNAKLREYILENPLFQNEKFVFDPEKYKRITEQRFNGVASYESMIREGMLEERLIRGLTLTAQNYDSEVQAFFAYSNEKRDVEYIFFPAADALAQVAEPAQDSIKAFYESSKAMFTLPAKANVEYVSVTPTLLGKPESFAQEAVKAYYDKNVQSKYTVPAQRQTSHILIRLAPEATDEEVKEATNRLQALRKELADGADFAELAKKHSQDPDTAPQGGDLGWVSKNMGLQSFNDALFALEIGDISEPLRTPLGLHILKVYEAKESSVKELSEVESEIRNILASEAGLVKIREALDALIEANVLSGNLEEVAKTHGLELKATDLKTAAELEAILSVTPENMEKIVKLAANVPLDTPMQTTEANSYIVARVKEKEESSVRPFDEVKDEIVTSLKEKAALEKALSSASAARKEFDNKAPESDTVKHVADVKRFGEIGTLGAQAALSLELFAAKAGEWLPNAYVVTEDGKQGAVLVRVKKVTSVNSDDVKPLEREYRMGELHKRQERMYNLFREALLTRAKIEITNNAYYEALLQQ